MAFGKLRRPSSSFISSSNRSITMNANLCTTLFFIVIFTVPALFVLHNRPSSLTNCTPFSSTTATNTNPSFTDSWSGDLRKATFSWNKLIFPNTPLPPNRVLKVAVFSRKWPTNSVPGGMERHAYTLHTALAKRGHNIHIFTSPFPNGTTIPSNTPSTLTIHNHADAAPGQWRYNKAWEQFVEENKRHPFDVVHSESVALPHWLARLLSNLIVTWHGTALESLQSSIYQDLTRNADTEKMSPEFNQSVQGVIPKVLNEIRFFHKYAHHIAISDSCGEMLRDIYQIPNKRVHVILNGVSESDFASSPSLGTQFRSKIGLPNNATLVFGVAGRLVKDKGHPLLFTAFSKFMKRHPTAYLIIAGSGPWANRYRELGSQVMVLGSMNPKELKSFYNAVDVFVNPTLRPQGLDLTLMEAMMSGKPVLASRFASIKGSVVVDDEFGFMFAPNVDELEEALESVASEGKDRLIERGKKCGVYAERMFAATKMAMAYERLFLCVKNETFCMYP